MERGAGIVVRSAGNGAAYDCRDRTEIRTNAQGRRPSLRWLVASGWQTMTDNAVAPAAGDPGKRRIGDVGAGVMGRDIAETLATHGHSVVLIDLSPDILTSAGATIRASL